MHGTFEPYPVPYPLMYGNFIGKRVIMRLVIQGLCNKKLNFQNGNPHGVSIGGVPSRTSTWYWEPRDEMKIGALSMHWFRHTIFVRIKCVRHRSNEHRHRVSQNRWKPRWIHPQHRDQAMAEFLASEDVRHIHSTDAATPREENGPVWSVNE